MIVSMKKIFLIIQNKDAPSALGVLSDVGSVHVEHEEIPSGGDINKLKEDIQSLTKVIEIVSQEDSKGEQKRLDDWEFKIKEIIGFVERLHQLETEIVRRQVQIDKWQSWGDFSLEDIKVLLEKGIYVQLYEIPAKKISQVPKEVVLEQVSRKGGVVRCAAISEKKVELPFKKVSLPAVRLSELESLQQESRISTEEIRNKLKECAQFSTAFKEIYTQVEFELKFHESLAGMGKEEGFVYLKGYCPIDRCRTLQDIAARESWALLIDDPSDDDKVPTLLFNPKWVRIVSPVFGIMNILPGYKEVDISLFFLLFFSVFFGILIGDAGYGAMFFILTLLGHKRFGRKIKDKAFFFLMYALSSCAIVWGVLTGTIFGQAWLAGSIQPLLPWLQENENVQLLCFIIGVSHLSVAHLWRGILKMPSIAAIAEVGWLMILWAMFFLVRVLILGAEFVAFAKVLFIVGPVLVILFSQPKKSPVKTISGGLKDLLMNIVNTFTDIVSYIRLFAVGLASIAVADAFNKMAGDIGFNSILAGLGTAAILVFGHALNIILGAMAVLVHGVRLNVLEFSSHLNMEWSGVQYNPLKRIKNIKVY